MRSRPLALLILCALLGSCQTDATNSGAKASPFPLSDNSVQAIAGDLAWRFSEQAGPIGKPIRLQGTEPQFSSALATALRGWGYTVITADPAQSARRPVDLVDISYGLTDLDGQVLADLSMDRLRVARAYAISASGATPSSPLSRMN